MSFKPMKSKRTSRLNHSYENSQKRYENQPPIETRHTPSSSPLPPRPPPPTPQQKQPPLEQQKHHRSSPSLGQSSSLSIPPSSVSSSSPTSSSILGGTSPNTSTSYSNMSSHSVPNTADATANQRKDDGSGFTFSGYHINRISSAISKNTQQLFKSFSTIATTTSNNGNSTARTTLAKAFSINSGGGNATSKDEKVVLDSNSNVGVVKNAGVTEFSEGSGVLDTEEHSGADDLNNGYYEDETTLRPRDLSLRTSSTSMVSDT